MKNSKKIPALEATSTQEQLAAVLDISSETFASLISEAGTMYIEIPLKKKDGTPRAIHAPKEDLKKVQRAVLDKLLIQAPLPKCAYGFNAGKGIVENARLHSKNPYVLNVDIKDFFPSVHYTRVERLFLELGASEEIAKELTTLTTYEHALPQGAPSSPYIAALVLAELDRRITILCARNRLIYSRYFDDITISGSSRVQRILPTVIGIISACGFEAHTREDKLRLYEPGEIRLITGIEVQNGKLQVPSIKELTAYVDRLISQGMNALESENPLKEQLSLKGKIVFLNWVDPKLGVILKDEFKKIVW
jgi:RNA-directed DNA polymerase